CKWSWRRIGVVVGIPFRALWGAPVIGDRSDYGGNRCCSGEYCDSPRGVILVSADLRSFTSPTFAVAVAWALLVAGDSALGQASRGAYGGAISFGGREWALVGAGPCPSGHPAH